MKVVRLSKSEVQHNGKMRGSNFLRRITNFVWICLLKINSWLSLQDAETIRISKSEFVLRVAGQAARFSIITCTIQLASICWQLLMDSSWTLSLKVQRRVPLSERNRGFSCAWCQIPIQYTDPALWEAYLSNFGRKVPKILLLLKTTSYEQ